MINTQGRLSNLMPRKFLGLGRDRLSHIGDLTKPYFVAVGCSVVGGETLCVDYKDSWVNRLATRLGLEHINLGFDGSSLEYQYEKIKMCEKILPDCEFIVWMQSPPWRSHHMRLGRFIGDRWARMKIDSELFRTKESLGAQWQKLLMYYDQAKKNQKILFTNTWSWSPQLLLPLESKMKKSGSRYYVNAQNIIDYGEDNMHPGTETHKQLAVEIEQHVLKHFPHLEKWVATND